jgi:DNA-binding NarL/FixJ family response regulator
MPERVDKRILIVEDEGLIAAAIQNQLERFGYRRPDIANSGEEALQLARSAQFDLALMDICLKGELDGIGTAKILWTEFHVPVVYLTAHSDQETLDRAELTEPLGYIVKPFAEATLRSTVQMSLYRQDLETRLRDAAARTRIGEVRLTARERQVLRLVAEGFTAKEIAETIHVATKTVEFHKYNVMRKASARGTADLTRFAIQTGIASL